MADRFAGADEAVRRTDQGFAAKSETLYRPRQSSLSLRAP
jgi:hypothetical protein